jgi:hypothetical protein
MLEPTETDRISESEGIAEHACATTAEERTARQPTELSCIVSQSACIGGCEKARSGQPGLRS